MEAIFPLLMLVLLAGIAGLVIIRRRRAKGGGMAVPSVRISGIGPAAVRFRFSGMLLAGIAALAVEALIIPLVGDTSWMDEETPQYLFSLNARYFLDGCLIYVYVLLLARVTGVFPAAIIAFPVAMFFNGIPVAVLEAFVVTPVATALYADVGVNIAARLQFAMHFLTDAVLYQMTEDLDYWTNASSLQETLEYFFEEPVWFLSYAVAALVSGLLLSGSNAAQRPAARLSNGTASSSGSGGRDMKEQPYEVTRLALAHALMINGMARIALRERLQYRYRGHPPEPGLDRDLLKAVLDRLIARDRKYRLFFMVCVAVAVAGFALQNPLVLIAPLLAGAVLHVVKAHAERFGMRRMFRTDDFDIDTVRKHYGLAGNAAESEPVNVITYKGYMPFDFAGETTSRMAFTVDLSRGKDGGQPRDVLLGQLYQAVAGSVQQSGDYTVQDIALVHGEDVCGITEIQPHKLIAPKPYVGPEVMSQWLGQDDNRIRHYKWIMSESWGQQLIVSYFLRLHVSGRILHAETTQCVMTPPADEWRRIDRTPPMKLATAIAWFFGSVLYAPVGVLASAGFGLIRLVESFNLMFAGGRDGIIRTQIKQNPNYNYGADPSIRSEMASQAYLHYYQRMDSELHEKALARRILDTTIDFLESRDVDVSTLKESRTTIINSGVLVQGGDVTAQSLAVGDNAKSAVSGGGGAKSGGSK
jgi:hypothetical protein